MGFVLVARSKLTTKNAAISGLIYMFCECTINITKIKHKNTLLTEFPVKRVYPKIKISNPVFIHHLYVLKQKLNQIYLHTAGAAYFFFSTTLLNTRIATTTAIPITSVSSAG